MSVRLAWRLGGPAHAAWGSAFGAALGLVAVAAHADASPLAAIRAKLQAKDFDGARTLAEARIATAPDDADAHFLLGRAELGDEAFEPAAAAFEQAIRLRPSFEAARFNYALSLRKAGKLQRAADAYRVYLAEKPNDADAHYGLGETLEASGDPAGAAKAFDDYAANEKDPTRTSWVEKARARASSLRARASGGAAIAAAPVAPPPPLPAAPVLAASAAIEQPVAAPVAADAPVTAAVPERPASYVLGRRQLEARDYAAARASLVAAEREAPSDPYVRALAAASAMFVRDTEAAIVSYRAALAQASDALRPEVRWGLAEALRASGQAEAARAELTALLADASATPSLKAKAEARLR